ncbi:uncharacterized protein LOC120742857 [Simochromis diagramma]|uniref:uncharacterized protein LOC120742857 n=1 Tax=Simochromis diagramma TaxID=43689 RepID=UPI001A7ECD87|nr:uncharacterized protein LOC120742857 [Simochromis diagramma]
MTMREAGQRVQPNLSRFTVASIIRTFREENRTQRRPPGGGRLRLLSEEQERELVNMVIANNVIRLQEIQRRVIEDYHLFRGINAISLSTIDRILRKNQFRMKQAYRVPFERNSDRVKNQRVEYVQRIFEIEGRPVPHEIIFVNEAGFNLTKRRKRGRNIIGHRAILDYREPAQPEQPHYVVVWDNVSFHRAALAMEEACLDISVDACQGWIRHARGFYPRCLAGANIACDVDEILWPDPDQRQDAEVG